jgi:A nuclease family of the HNH/ENDO VII superfamily with conserved AHH
LPLQQPHAPFQLEQNGDAQTPESETVAAKNTADTEKPERGGVATLAERGKTVTPPSKPASKPPRKAKSKTAHPALLKAKRPQARRDSKQHSAGLHTDAKQAAVTHVSQHSAPTPQAFKAQSGAQDIQLKRPDLSGADAKERAKIERELKQSQAHAGQFMTSMRARQKRLEGLGATLPIGIKKAARAAVAQAQSAGRQQRAAVNTRIAGLIAAAKQHAASAIGQIAEKANAAKAAVPRVTQTLTQQLETAKQDALTQAEAKREPQRAVIETAYEGKRSAFLQTGQEVGDQAPPKADVKAQEYLARPTPEDQDSWHFMGVREKDQNKARADAAHQVGDSYAKGFPEQAGQQLDKLKAGSEENFGVQHDFDQLEELVFRPFRTSADDVQKGGLDALKTSETQALHSIDDAKTQFTQSLHARLTATLSQLNQQRGSLTQIIDSLTAQNVAQINTQGDQSIERINTTLRTLSQGVERAMSGVQQKLRTQGAPKPKELQRVLRAIEKQVETTLGTQIKGMQQSAAQTQKQLHTTAAQGAARVKQTASSGLVGAKNTEAQLITAAAGIIAAAAQSFQAAEKNHQTGAQKHVDASKDTYTKMLGGVDKVLEATPAELEKKLEAALASLKGGLEQSLANDMMGVINTEAEKAAAQVPPRWKGLLKILLVIAVLIVVALIAGPAVIAAAGTLLGSGLLGAIVGGAILGAVSGAVIQMGNNLIDEKPLMEGVGKAMLTGAVAGAAGGFLGAGVGALTSGITSTGVRIAVGTTLDVGVGLVSGGVGQLAGGESIGQVLDGFKPDRLLETLSSPDQLIGMAMSIAAHKSVPGSVKVHAEGAEPPKLNFMERTQQKYAGVGEKFAFKAADVTGLKTANVRSTTSPRLESTEAKVNGYNQRRTQAEFGEGVHPNDRKIHIEEAKTARADNSDLVKIKEKLFGSDREFTPGTKGYDLNAEATKHQKMADWRFEEAQRQKAKGNTAEYERLIQEAHDLQGAAHDYQELARDPKYQNEPGDGEIAGGKRTYDNHDEIKDLVGRGKPFDKTKLPDGYTTFELEGGRKIAARLTPEGTIDLKHGVLLVNEKGLVSVSPQNRVSYDYIKIYENNPNARPGISFGKDGYTVHHMIADKVASQHALTVKAMELYGFHVDQFGNYAAMPMKEQFFKLDGTEVGHWSSHPEFDITVEAGLSKIQTDLEAIYGPISGWSTHTQKAKIAAQLKQEITNLQTNTFEKIKNGQIPMTDEGTSGGFGRIH